MTAPHYKLVIFDFDGTLADSFGWFLDVFDQVADHFHFRRLDRTRIDDFRGQSTRELLAHHGVPLWKVPMIAAHARRLQGRHLDAITVFAGMAEVVAALHDRGVALALVSSNAPENITQVLGAETMARFRHIACGASLLGKTAKFRGVLKALNTDAPDTLAIGDEIRDIEAAHAAGMKAGAVTWGYALPERLRRERPDHLFEQPHQITDLFSDNR
jgi:phosphoglycolate phosphatase